MIDEQNTQWRSNSEVLVENYKFDKHTLSRERGAHPSETGCIRCSEYYVE